MLYSRGVEEDEKKHRAYHLNFTEGVKWGPKKKCEMFEGREEFLGGRIVQISPHYTLPALDEVVKFIQREFGSCDNNLQENQSLFLWIVKQRVRGILICESLDIAYRIIADVTYINVVYSNLPPNIP